MDDQKWQIAVNILPVGNDAIWFGAKFGFGFTCGVGFAGSLSMWIYRILDWVF